MQQFIAFFNWLINGVRTQESQSSPLECCARMGVFGFVSARKTLPMQLTASVLEGARQTKFSCVQCDVKKWQYCCCRFNLVMHMWHEVSMCVSRKRCFFGKPYQTQVVNDFVLKTCGPDSSSSRQSVDYQATTLFSRVCLDPGTIAYGTEVFLGTASLCFTPKFRETVTVACMKNY